MSLRSSLSQIQQERSGVYPGVCPQSFAEVHMLCLSRDGCIGDLWGQEWRWNSKRSPDTPRGVPHLTTITGSVSDWKKNIMTYLQSPSTPQAGEIFESACRFHEVPKQNSFTGESRLHPSITTERAAISLGCTRMGWRLVSEGFESNEIGAHSPTCDVRNCIRKCLKPSKTDQYPLNHKFKRQ